MPITPAAAAQRSGAGRRPRRTAAARRPRRPALARGAGLFPALPRVALLAGLAIVAGCLLNLAPPLLVRGLIDDAIPAGRASGSADPLLPLRPRPGARAAGRRPHRPRPAVPVRAVGQGILSDLRNRLFRHLQTQSLRFFTTTRAGEITSRVSDDVAQIRWAIDDTLPEILSNLVDGGRHAGGAVLGVVAAGPGRLRHGAGLPAAGPPRRPLAAEAVRTDAGAARPDAGPAPGRAQRRRLRPDAPVQPHRRGGRAASPSATRSCCGCGSSWRWPAGG